MKSLDDVIKALEMCTEDKCVCLYGCPYSHLADGDDGCEYHAIPEMQKDALQWLKGYQQHIELDKILDHLARQNNPLSWEELVTMIGIPVWVEIEKNSPLWAIPMSITTLGNNERMCMVGSENGHAVQVEVSRDSTNGWKAYLKEHRYG